MSKKSKPGDGTHGKGVKGETLSGEALVVPPAEILETLARPGSRRRCPPAASRPAMLVARGLAPPALYGEFTPWRASPVTPDRLGGGGGTAELCSALAATVEDLLQGVETVAVALSGGIDSLAVAAAVARTGRRCVALTADLVGDDGISAAEQAAQLVAATGVDVCWKRVDLKPDQDGWTGTSSKWVDHSAIPAARRALNQAAATVGAEVLLSGDGADALLAAPPLLADPSWRPAAARRLDTPTGRSEAVRWLAAGWPELFDPVPDRLLTAEAGRHARQWTLAWLQRRLDLAAELGWDMLALDAWLQAVGLAPLPPAGPVPEPSVFLHPTMIAAALSLPIDKRYDPGADSAYRARKRALVCLVPPRMRRWLPTTKQTFHDRTVEALAAEAARPPHRLVDARVVDVAGWRANAAQASGDWRAATAGAVTSRYNARLATQSRSAPGTAPVLAA